MKTPWIAVGSLLVASLAGGASVQAVTVVAAPTLTHVCAAAAPGDAQCLADVVTNQPIARSGGTITGYDAAQLDAAYNLPINQGAGQTIAVVDAYDDPDRGR